MGKWKNIILGEKMPDKDDPKYREKYEKDVEAGRKFARVTRIDRLAGHVQRFAEKHRGLFLGIVMAIVLGCLAVNVYHFSEAWKHHRRDLPADRADSTYSRLLRDYGRLEDLDTLLPIQENEDGKDQD